MVYIKLKISANSNFQAQKIIVKEKNESLFKYSRRRHRAQ